MATINSRINLNLSQNPNETSQELNKALDPVYNALRLLQREIEGNSNSVEITGTNLEEVKASLASLDSAVNDLSLTVNSLSFPTITLSGNTPSNLQGNSGDLWIQSTVNSKTFYYKFGDRWIRVLTAADTNSAVTFAGTYSPLLAYNLNTIVKLTDGSVWLSLTSIPLGSTPSVANSSWLMIQESLSAGIGEAVLSSRAPALPGDPPNFVISRLGDLVYARI
jgi:hypothetical protein